MMLTPTEQERLTIFTAAEIARRNIARGIRLSQPEAVAYICDELMVGAREGRSVTELMSLGSTLLTTDHVLPGVAALIRMIQVEGMFADGTKMVCVHEPIRPGQDRARMQHARTPGEIITPEGEVELNPGRPRTEVEVANTGDRPVQVGSHFHFFEANRALDFDRAKSFGMRLDIPAGTAVRFEPGVSKPVTLVAFGGHGHIGGFNGLTEGDCAEASVRAQARQRAQDLGFKGA